VFNAEKVQRKGHGQFHTLNYRLTLMRHFVHLGRHARLPLLKIPFHAKTDQLLWRTHKDSETTCTARLAMESQDRMEDALSDDVFLQDGLCPTIAEHVTQCNALFQRCMAMPEIVPDPTVVENQLGRFTHWVSNMDVYGNVSMDRRLRSNPTAVDIIHQLLDVICDTLTSCKYSSHYIQTDGVKDSMLIGISTTVKPVDDAAQTPSSARQGMSDDGDSDSDVDQEEDNISKITDSIGGTVKRLIRVSNSACKAANANQAMQSGHRHGWECRAPCHDLVLFDEEIQYQEHCIKEHAVPETQARIISSAARRLVPDKVPE
jgi:hypothetical protein